MSRPSSIKLGISACVVGEQVRFDGGHKRSVFCVNQLSQFFSFKPLCPEMAIGMGVPRQTIRLVERSDGIHLVGSRDPGLDVTEPMQAYAHKTAETLTDISGYIFCAKSPSCGMERVKVYAADGKSAQKNGVGIYAQAVMRRWPDLPVEEDGRLNDANLRENFITRIYAYADWQRQLAEGMTPGRLTKFHTRYKYLLLAHEPEGYRELGRLVADCNRDNLADTLEQYRARFMQALKKIPSRGRHHNVMQHMLGFFKRQLSDAHKQEMVEVMDKYRQGLLPLLVPLTLLNHYLREFPHPFIAEQVYLDPFPEELRLRYSA